MSTIYRVVPRVTARPWGDEVLIAATAEYTGKLLRRYGQPPYHRAGLQYHPDRDETAHLAVGQAWLYWIDEHGELCRTLVQAGETVHIPRGAVHSFETIGDSVVFESSTPGWALAVRVEDRYDIRTARERPLPERSLS